MSAWCIPLLMVMDRDLENRSVRIIALSEITNRANVFWIWIKKNGLISWKRKNRKTLEICNRISESTKRLGDTSVRNSYLSWSRKKWCLKCRPWKAPRNLEEMKILQLDSRRTVRNPVRSRNLCFNIPSWWL